MKKHRLTALVLAMLMLFQTLPVLATAPDEATLFPIDDTYIQSGSRWKNKNYGNEGAMLFGSNYDRTALLKFDLSSFDLTNYNGALLNITFSAASESGNIDAYIVDSDWAEKTLTYANYSTSEEFVIASSYAAGAGQKLSLNLNGALQRAKELGEKIISIALKSDSGNIHVFSSEAQDISKRPSLTISKDSAFVYGQYDYKFPTVTQQQFKIEMQKAIAKGHPYLLATKERIDKVKKYAFGADAEMTQLYSNVKKNAEEIYQADIINLDAEIADNASYITKSENIMLNMMDLCLVYLAEGDEKYAEKAYAQAEYLCTLETWGTNQMIDISRLLVGVAICYDWLYDWLSAEQKEILEQGTRTLCLNMVSDVIHNPQKPEYKWSFHQFLFDNGSNHCAQNTCGIIAASMAFAETDIDFMTDLMTFFLGQLTTMCKGLYPDGMWSEGPSYWTAAAPWANRTFQFIKSAFGHCFDIENISFLKNIADYPIYSSSGLGYFNFGDCHFNQDYTHNSYYYSIGEFSGNVALMNYALNGALERNSAEPSTVLLYNPDTVNDANLTLENDKLLNGTAYQITLRSSREGSQNIFAGINVRNKLGTHSHMDCGTLVFDALGERWITNNSRETYYSGYNNGTPERWTWYRTHAEASSCVVIDPSEHPGQDPGSEGMGIEDFKSGVGGAYAISNLTNAYSSQVDSYKRGIQLADNRKVFVVQDEIDLKNPSEMYSFFNIWEGEIELLDDGKSAILHKDNKKVYVTVDCDKEFTLLSLPAEPLPESAKPAPSKPNTPNLDFLRLAIHFDEVEAANIRVCFIPYICEEELSAVTCKEFIPMSEWSVQDNIKVAPKLDDLKIDGVSIEGFNPYNRCYEVENSINASQLTTEYDSGKYEVEVRQDDETGVVSVLVTDKMDNTNINSYMIGEPVVPKPSFVDISNMSALNITKTSAPEPQAENNIENLYDDDLSTRWSADGAGTVMTIELDKVRKVGCIAVSVYNNDKRRQSFDVSLSVDGRTWTHIDRFLSSGVTPDLEYYDLKNTEAQYVKITYNSSTKSTWNSITELKLYGK